MTNNGLILSEHEQKGFIFGVRKIVTANPNGALPIYDEKIETPFGPAAGPNTSLPENIVAYVLRVFFRVSSSSRPSRSWMAPSFPPA